MPVSRNNHIKRANLANAEATTQFWTKSAVHVRALTYCDIHMINVQKLKEILEFYKAFAQTFARNLVLTFDLSKRTVFYRIADKHLEKLLAEDNDPRTMFTPSQVSNTYFNIYKKKLSTFKNSKKFWSFMFDQTFA